MHWLLSELQKLGGYYQCPESPEGKPLGPLVGYAGKYDDDGTKKQFVGKVYYNFAKGEQNPKFRQTCAYQLRHAVVETFAHVDYVIGLPMGGIMLAVELGNQLGCDTVFAEKQIIALATDTAREQSRLVLQRHNLERQSRIVLVEDVCNNFSTTIEAIQLVESLGCDVAGIACAINRSPEDHFHALNYVWPVASVVHQHTPEWKQDDPVVAEDIAAGNVVWKPKNEWDRLAEAMKAVQRG